jgi:hypothetical protein
MTFDQKDAEPSKTHQITSGSEWLWLIIMKELLTWKDRTQPPIENLAGDCHLQMKIKIGFLYSR